MIPFPNLVVCFVFLMISLMLCTLYSFLDLAVFTVVFSVLFFFVVALSVLFAIVNTCLIPFFFFTFDLITYVDAK